MSVELDLRRSVVRVCREDEKVSFWEKVRKKVKKERRAEVRKRRCEYVHVSGICRSVWGFCFFWVGEKEEKTFWMK